METMARKPQKEPGRMDYYEMLRGRLGREPTPTELDALKTEVQFAPGAKLPAGSNFNTEYGTLLEHSGLTGDQGERFLDFWIEEQRRKQEQSRADREKKKKMGRAATWVLISALTLGALGGSFYSAHQAVTSPAVTQLQDKLRKDYQTLLDENTKKMKDLQAAQEVQLKEREAKVATREQALQKTYETQLAASQKKLEADYAQTKAGLERTFLQRKAELEKIAAQHEQELKQKGAALEQIAQLGEGSITSEQTDVSSLTTLEREMYFMNNLPQELKGGIAKADSTVYEALINNGKNKIVVKRVNEKSGTSRLFVFKLDTAAKQVLSITEYATNHQSSIQGAIEAAKPVRALSYDKGRTATVVDYESKTIRHLEGTAMKSEGMPVAAHLAYQGSANRNLGELQILIGRPVK